MRNKHRLLRGEGERVPPHFFFFLQKRKENKRSRALTTLKTKQSLSESPQKLKSHLKDDEKQTTTEGKIFCNIEERRLYARHVKYTCKLTKKRATSP